MLTKTTQSKKENKENLEKTANQRSNKKPLSWLSLAIIVIAVFAFKDSILDNNNVASSSMVPSLQVGDYVLVNKMRYSFRLPFFEWELWRFDNPQRGDVVTFVPPQSTRSIRHYVKRVIGLPQDTIRLRSGRACRLHQNKNADCDPNDSNRIIITQIEYQPKGSKEWKSYQITPLAQQQSQRLLNESDDAGVIDPSYWPKSKYTHYPSRVFENQSERDGATASATFLTTESSAEYGEVFLCPEIFSSGCVLGKDEYFVMGDNRDNSEDSRIIGFIERAAIRGKAQYIYFSINWRDGLCSDYWNFFGGDNNQTVQQDSAEKIGFALPQFDQAQQKKYCTSVDGETPRLSFFSAIGSYLRHTFLYRIPRMDIRWLRIGNRIK